MLAPDEARGKRSRRRRVNARGSTTVPLVLAFLLPWPRLTLLIRGILATEWDAETWPVAKAELRRALELRRQLVQSGWWN